MHYRKHSPSTSPASPDVVPTHRYRFDALDRIAAGNPLCLSPTSCAEARGDDESSKNIHLDHRTAGYIPGLLDQQHHPPKGGSACSSPAADRHRYMRYRAGACGRVP